MAEANNSPINDPIPSPAVLDLMVDIWHLLGNAEGEVDACEAVGVLAQIMGMIVGSIEGRDERRDMAENCQCIVAHAMNIGIVQGDAVERVN